MVPASSDTADGVGVVLDLLFAGFSGPLAQASMELWIAARTDEELRASLAPVDRELARHVQEIARAFLGPALDETRFQELFWLTVNLARGLAIDEILDGSPTRRSALIAPWRDLARGSIPHR